MSRKKLTSILPLMLAFTLALSSCGGTPATEEPSPSPSATPAPTATPTPEPTPTPYNGPVNPLTGLPLENGSPDDRPIAVMLNNLREALPQMGVSQADIIYEVLAEGGITRMLGVFQSVEGVGSIGTVRSARPYYLELALGHDAVFLHAGGSEEAYEKIRAWGVTALDCVRGPYEGSLFWRDAQRRQSAGLEHSVVTSGETITALFPGYTFRKTHEEGYDCGLTFAEEGTPEGGEAAATVTIPYSYYKTGVFEYEEESGLYLVSEYGEPYIDGNTGEQVGVTNLLVLETDCNLIPGDAYGRITVDLTEGEGWFACGGAYIPISWEKEAPAGELRYYTEDGEPLVLGQGKSYVSIVPTGCDVTFE